MDFLKTHAARLYGVAAAGVALVLVYVPELPSAAILALVAAVLGVGEVVQRADDSKTLTALHTPAPLSDYQPFEDDDPTPGLYV